MRSQAVQQTAWGFPFLLFSKLLSLEALTVKGQPPQLYLLSATGGKLLILHDKGEARALQCLASLREPTACMARKARTCAAVASQTAKSQ